MIDYLLPVFLIGTGGGVLIYYYLINKLHDIFLRHYPYLFGENPQDYRVNLDQPFQALKEVPPILKSGEWKNLPSQQHIQLCVWTRRVDKVWIVSFIGLFLPFFF
ncbi:hypothetical protein [Chitinibacter sp. S2-10]|uniref:hypothetical protein n=1 Tax=Chitinibacter sp. S2-10 TaxID=3373597 RepID=UPI003977A692